MALAVDVGGTKLAAGLVNEQGRLLDWASVPTPNTAPSAKALFAVLSDLIHKVLDRSPSYDVVVCGVGSGGPMTGGGDRVSPLNIPQWRGFELRACLVQVLGVTTVVDNDAKALALGEGWTGAAAGIDNYLAMVVSTGIGGGIVLNGQLLEGADGNAGHIGHLIVEPGGRLCRCGARGCLEAEASGRSIEALTGRPAALADATVVARTGTLVGRGVASVANLCDLKLAVAAGSVALGYREPFFAAAQAEIDRCARLDFSRGTRLLPAGLGPQGPLVGAAAVGWRAIGRARWASTPHPGGCGQVPGTPTGRA